MGIVNVTPDSFSDGGRYLAPEAAVAHGLALVEAGADLLDVGGESTRPGAEPVDAREEAHRVVPVVERLAAEAGVPVSVDTTKAAVAAAALDAGAVVVNDVSAGRFDPEILDVAAGAGAGYVAMHMLGEPRTMQDAPHYDDVVAEVGDFLAERVDAARGRRSRRGCGRSRSRDRLRQDRRAQPHAPRTAGRPGRAGGCAAPRGDVAEALPRLDPSRRGGGAGRAAGGAAGRRDARHGGLGDRPRRARSCECTTSVPRHERSRWSRRWRGRRHEPARSLGTGARAARVLLDHHGAARRVGAARGLRAQPPKGASPGGAHLARRARLHARALAARVAPQPARVRRGRPPVRARTAGSPRRLAAVARADLLDAREVARRPERACPDPPRGVR